MDTFDASYTSVSETQTATDTSLNFRTSRSSRSGNQAGALVVWHPAVDAASRLQQYYEQLITTCSENHGLFQRITQASTQMAKQLLSDMRPPGALTPADLLSYQPYVGHFAKYFIQKSVLGKGGFATVYEAIDKLDGIGYAVKAIKFKTVAHFLKHYEKILREVRLLARLSHKHVIRYYGAWIELTPLDGSISFSESYVPPISSPKPILKAHTVFEELSSDDSVDLARSPLAGSPIEQLVNVRSISKSSSRIHTEHLSVKKSQMDSWDIDYSVTDVQSESVISTVSIKSMAKVSDISTDESELDLPPNRLVKKPSQRTLVALSEIPSSTSTPKKSTPSKTKFTFTLFIKTQLYTGQTLKDFLQRRVAVDEEQSMTMFRQIIQGLHYIHSNSICHRDVKPGNIFISHDGIVVIGDFGLAKELDSLEGSDRIVPAPPSPSLFSSPDRSNTVLGSSSSKHTSGLGTASYAAPEQIATTGEYTVKVDIFAAGIVLFELFNVFSSLHERAHIIENVRRGVLPQDFMSKHPLIAKWVIKMTDTFPEKRPSCEEILKGDLIPRTLCQRKLFGELDGVSDEADEILELLRCNKEPNSEDCSKWDRTLLVRLLMEQQKVIERLTAKAESLGAQVDLLEVENASLKRSLSVSRPTT